MLFMFLKIAESSTALLQPILKFGNIHVRLERKEALLPFGQIPRHFNVNLGYILFLLGLSCSQMLVK